MGVLIPPLDFFSERTNRQEDNITRETREGKDEDTNKKRARKRMTRNQRTGEQENKGPSERIQENLGTRGQGNNVKWGA